MVRSALGIRWVCAVALWLGVGALAAPARAQDSRELGDHEPATVAGEERATPVVFEGVVLDPQGAPAQGAVVVTSAGGQAVVDEQGVYRLEASVPVDADRLQVTAIGRGSDGPLASTTVSLAPASSRVLVHTLSLAQGGACTPSWLPTFGEFPGTAGIVRAFAVHDDGSGPALYVGGVITGDIARWDGSRWSGVGGGMNSWVFALAVYDDGGGAALYAGGSFTNAGGVPANHIARWDGSSWSALGAGMDADVDALAVYDDGSGLALYAGGEFTTAGGVSASHIARWDGSSWSALGAGMDADVDSLEVYDDGGGTTLYAGGAFTTAGGVSASHIAKWDGASWSALGNGSNGDVYSLAVYDDGGGAALYAGGAFTTAGGGSASRIARWDGASWSALGSGTDGDVYALAVYDDGSGAVLHAGGSFTDAGGVSASRIAKWNGSSWSAFGSVLGDNLISHPAVLALAVYDDGGGERLYVGGTFASVGGVVAPSIARWDGTVWSTLGSGLNASVRALAVHDDGSGSALYVGGSFTGAGGVPLNGIAKWDGSGWTPLGTGMHNSGTSTVLALEVYDDGDGEALYAAGSFTMAGGVAATRIAKWDGSSWSALGSGVGNPLDQFVVWALAVYDDGRGPALYAGGAFTTAGGVSANRIAKWDGVSWSALGSGLGGGVSTVVHALEVYDDGNGAMLYGGGTFTSAGGMSALRIARWDGVAWSPVGGGFSNPVRALLAHDDGNGAVLYAGGSFGGHVAQWDGMIWSYLGGGTGNNVFALAVHDDGSGPALYVGGTFNVAGGMAALRIARWDGTAWSPVGGGMLGNVDVLAVYDDGGGEALYAGGGFDAVDSGDSNLAKWGCAPVPPPLTYCQGEPSSLGCVTSIDTSGVPSATGTNPFSLIARDMIPGEAGFVLYGFQKANLAFHGGRLCIKAPIQRWLPPKAAKSTGPPPCTGVLSRDFNARIQSGTDAQLTAGQTVFAQWLQRDPADPGGNLENLTNAVRFVIAP